MPQAWMGAEGRHGEATASWRIQQMGATASADAGSTLCADTGRAFMDA